MRNLRIILAFYCFIPMSSLVNAQQINIPVCPQKPKILEKHGHQRSDPYYWLNERENPEVIKYLEAENAYTDAIMADTKTLQEKLFEEMKGRIKQTDLSVPYFENGYWRYVRYEEGKEYPIYCQKKGTLEAKEEVTLDVNQLAEGLSYCNAGVIDYSDNNEIVAYSIDTVGRNNFTIRFKHLKTNQILPDALEMTWGNAVWAADNKTVFYVTKDPVTLRAGKLYKHVLGTPIKEDELVFEEKDETFELGVGRSKSKKYVFIHSGSTLTDEYQFLEASKPTEKFKLFLARERGHKYSIEHAGTKFYIRTNRNAPNFKLMETEVSQTSEKSWKEFIPHRTEIYLQSFDLFKDYLVIEERLNGLANLQFVEWKTKKNHSLDFGEPTYTASLSYNPEFNTSKVRYRFSSLITPGSVYEYDIAKRSKTLLKQNEVVGGYKPAEYIQEYHQVKARDGAMVPVSLVYKKGLKKDGSNPLLLYGYGSYGSTMEANFSSNRLSLLDRGFVFALAHIRGGQEKGRSWYEHGKFFNKKNTFYDFIDCAEYLIEQKFTKKDKLFAQGGSAGGLLMGAVTNMRPDLWKGVLAAVPFVDVVTTMLDESIPLTTGEYDEWGNPNQIDYYIYMLSYSPYDQVEKKPYPNILVTTGLHDSQVQYFEPAKWVAKLRYMKTDSNLLLLKTDMKAGHSGTTGRFKRLYEIAFEYAFMLKLLGSYQ